MDDQTIVPRARRRRSTGRRRIGITTVPLLVVAALFSVPAGGPASAAPAHPSTAVADGTVTAAAAWRSWNFSVWTGGKRGHAVGKVAYKPMGVKKRYGTCYHAQIPRWDQSWVDDLKADGLGVIVYLIYTDCRDGHTAQVTAGYVAGVKTPPKFLRTGVYKYATKAGVKICVHSRDGDALCTTRR